jgi:SPOC domain
MPLDSTIPQDVPVVARQMGGRILESDSPLWNVLFPSENLRIDGRVPVDSSSQYLLQMRLNSVKELLAVAFSPPSESTSLAFKFLMDHLLGKKYVMTVLVPSGFEDSFFDLSAGTVLYSLGVLARRINILVASCTSFHYSRQTRFRTIWSYSTLCGCQRFEPRTILSGSSFLIKEN